LRDDDNSRVITGIYSCDFKPIGFAFGVLFAPLFMQNVSVSLYPRTRVIRSGNIEILPEFIERSATMGIILLSLPIAPHSTEQYALNKGFKIIVYLKMI
jgi:hypothetical protein